MIDPSRLAIIEKNPIGHHLDAFRESAHAFCQELEEIQELHISSPTTVLGQAGDERLQGWALKLIPTLLAHPASPLLPSDIGNKNLYTDLLGLNTTINAGGFDVRRIISLLTAVINNESDNLIWDSAYKAVTNSVLETAAQPSTPPPLSAPHFQQTPSRGTTGGLQDTSERRTDVDRVLQDELEGNLTLDHPDFFATFFGGIPGLQEMATVVFQDCKDAEEPLFQEGVGWVGWPDSCEEAEVLEFFRKHTDRLLLFADGHNFRPSHRRHWFTKPNKPIPGSVGKRKLDIGLICNANNGPEDDGGQTEWSHILIPGELKQNPQEDNHISTWLDIARYAREVFGAQGMRRFVLGFTVCGSMMRLWEFDRLGVIGSTAFDINQDGKMFASVILGYLWMSEEELGVEPIIVEDGGSYTWIERNGQIERLQFGKLMWRHHSIIGRGTRCWRGSLEDKEDGQVVIKDSWQHEERLEEGLLLKEATDAGVKNVARYYHHETVRVGGKIDDVLNNVRKGLSMVGGRVAFPEEQPTPPEPATSLTKRSATRSKRGGSSSRSRGIKRKRSSGRVQPSLPPPPSSKRLRSDSPAKHDAAQRENRVHRRIVMQGIGKVIYKGSSPRAMLIGLLGGIKGHESLLDANILHRDISIGNVMLNMAEDDGFLIDLDVAIKIDRESASGASSRTGTKVYMAIGALYGDNHSFMHDLESFFWVLFWSCIHCNGSGLLVVREPYERWNYLDMDTLAAAKTGMIVDEARFEKRVVPNFTKYCTPLIPCIQKLRKVVFPDGKPWSREDRQVYSHMKSVIEESIQAL
ncbi:hypothetical protein EAF04_005367 [Stromatinia cepivora]|nr:hypothetical protein EAF04_005367 [Stromatinia cepivora]